MTEELWDMPGDPMYGAGPGYGGPLGPGSTWSDLGGSLPPPPSGYHYEPNYVEMDGTRFPAGFKTVKDKEAKLVPQPTPEPTPQPNIPLVSPTQGETEMTTSNGIVPIGSFGPFTWGNDAPGGSGFGIAGLNISDLFSNPLMLLLLFGGFGGSGLGSNFKSSLMMMMLMPTILGRSMTQQEQLVALLPQKMGAMTSLLLAGLGGLLINAFKPTRRRRRRTKIIYRNRYYRRRY
jgi:hypothetical protein